MSVPTDISRIIQRGSCRLLLPAVAVTRRWILTVIMSRAIGFLSGINSPTKFVAGLNVPPVNDKYYFPTDREQPNIPKASVSKPTKPCAIEV